MKKIITIITVVILYQLSIENCLAQSPNAIPYQGVARNAAGTILGLKSISLRFSLHDISALGTIVYSETHSANTTALGLFILNIGQGSPTTGTFASVDWSNGAKFLQVEMDASGGTNYVDMGTTQMMSVPFALYAKIAGPTPGAVVYKGTWDAISNTPHLSSGGGTKGDMYIVSNASSIPSENTSLDGNNKYLIGDTVIYNGVIYQALSTSRSSAHASEVLSLASGDISSTNVQDAIVEVRDDTDSKLSTKLNLSGGTMTGDLVLHSSPTVALGAATKQYVDDSLVPVQGQFANMIDSFISKTEDGVTIYHPSGATRKRFGIGDTSPEGPLGIMGEDGNDKMIAFTSNDGSNKWNINLNPTSDNVPGFSIDDSSSGTSMSRLFIQESTGNVGIGTINPEEKLHIQGSVEGGSVGLVIQNAASTENKGYSLRSYLKDKFQDGDIPTGQDRFAISEIPNESTGGSLPLERLTILSGGNVGVGTINPEEKLHIQGSVEGGSVGVVVQNAAIFKNRGWLLSHFEDGDIPERVGAFSISEKSSSSSVKVERITVLPTIGRVGINETLPYATLHVSRPESDPGSDIDLASGSGIAVFGPIIGNNLGMDSHQIQARTGSYVGGSTTMGLTASTLGLQPHGGDILIHGDSSVVSDKVIITGNGLIGLGKTPIEKLDVDGAVTFGDTDTTAPAEGTVRWHAASAGGSDLQVFKGGSWISLTAGSVWEKVDNTGRMIYLPPRSRVGVGIDNLTSALQVSENENVDSSSSAVIFNSNATTNSTSSSDNRIGLEIKNTGTWSSNADAKNIGVYVSNVSGQTSNESNIAAVMNGNVVIGNVNSSKVIGTNGTNVLAIQSGNVPTEAPGSTTAGGIQIFSDNISSDGATPLVSTFHVMNGNGDVIKLSKQEAITPSSTTAANSGDSSTDALINNMRDRIDALESKLQAMGLLK